MKLEEIVGYLPYGLKCKHGAIDDLEYGTLSEINCALGVFNCRFSIDLVRVPLSLVYPILHPLSDLTKPITVDGYNDGKEFVPIEELFTLYDTDGELDYLNILEDRNGEERQFMIEYCPFSLAQFLYKWHFDIHGLIERGEAIDINEVNSE